MRAAGTTPAGVRGEEQAARWVRQMFAGVAARYDLLNHLLSFQIDRYWRSRTAAEVRDIVRRPGARALDLCCGTADLLIELEKAAARGLFGCDFCRPMLEAAREKLRNRRLRSALLEADALALPFSDASFDLVAVAFGVRNYANYRKGFLEMRRVLKPGGVAAILEFSEPPSRLVRLLYETYSRHVLPRVGGWLSGSRAAYSYLPESVRRFPQADELAELLLSCGFKKVRYRRMTFGIVALHLATA